MSAQIAPSVGLLVSLLVPPLLGADGVPHRNGIPNRIATIQAVSVSAGASTSRDWPQWRGPGRDGKSSATGLLQDWKARKPKLVWSSKGMGSGYASVAVVGGRIYTTGNQDDTQTVVAADERTGRVLWTTPVTEMAPKHGYGGARSTPTVDGDRLYVVPSNGSIVCLDAKSGNIRWRRDFRKEWNGRMMSGWGFSESPLVDGDKVLCTPGGNEATIVALDKQTGKEIWRSAVPEGGGAGYSSIVISEGAGVKQYVQLLGSGVVGVRAEDGEFLWKYSRIANGTANIPTPIITGDRVFAATGYGAGAALLELTKSGRDGVQAKEVYFLPGRQLQNHHGGMVLVGDYVYLGNGHNKGFPTCVELKTGKIAWGGKLRGPGSGSAAVTYADGNLVFRYQSGQVALIAADPADYDLRGTFRPVHVEKQSWAHPVVCNGRLYLREQDVLMCYDVTAK